MSARRGLAFGDDDRRRAIEALKRHLADELELDVGDLKARLLLDFFLQELGPTVYNRGLDDARAYFEERAADLEGVHGLPEFPGSSRGVE